MPAKGAGITATADGYHLIDEATALRRGDTLHFGPALDLLRRLARECGDRPVSVLDVGCGGGQLSRMLDAGGVPHKYVGTDLNHHLLAKAQVYYGTGTRIVADACRQPFPEKSFDVVTAYGIAFLLPDAVAFIRNALQLARRLALINVNAPPPGVTSMRTHAEGDVFHWMGRTDFFRERLAACGLPGPDHVLGWETPIEGRQAIPSFRGPESRLQMTLVWVEQSLRGEGS